MSYQLAKLPLLLIERGVSIANLDASGSARASNSSDVNLACLFARQGLTITIAMSYNVLDPAAAVFHCPFFDIYLRERNPFNAMRRGRQALGENKLRKGDFGVDIELDDFVPCIYLTLPMENNQTEKSASRHRWMLSPVKDALITTAISPFMACAKEATPYFIKLL